MDFEAVIESLPLFFRGLVLTIQLVVLSLGIGMVLAIPVSLAAASRTWAVSVLPRAFIYCFRGTPLLVQLYLLYFGLSQFESVRESFVWPVLKEAYWCALIAFALNTAAYTAEILRGAVVQTPYGEIEAARACGMGRATVVRRIILPSAFRRALPAYGNECIFMLHGTALAGLVTLLDVFGAARVVQSKNFVPFEAYSTAGVFYLALTFSIVALFRIWEKRWHAHLRPRASGA